MDKIFIRDEAFKRGAELICQTERKLTKKKKAELETIKIFGDDDDINQLKYNIVLKCPYTEKCFSRSDHFKKYNIDKEEFKFEYGGTSAIEMVAHKIMYFYRPHNKKWLEQNIECFFDHSTEKQQEKTEKAKEEGKKSFLNWYVDIPLIKSHLNRNKTISIFPKNEKPSWISFDVDTGENAFTDSEKIVDTMINYGINRKDILVTFSGGKGYHIEIFFKYPIEKKYIKNFGEKIFFLSGNDINQKYNSGKIEIFPVDNTAIKLSLGINKETNKLTRVLNENMEYFKFVYQDYIYFLNIDRINNDLIWFIIKCKDVPDEPKESNLSRNLDEGKEDIPEQDYEDEGIEQYSLLPSLDAKISAIKKIFENGLKGKNTHHFWAFKIGLWMYEVRKLDRDTAEEELIEWTENNIEFCKTKSGSINDAKQVIRSLWDKEHEYSLANKLKERILNFYPAEIKLIKKIQKQAKRERKRTLTNAPSLIYFSFICMGKYFNNSTYNINRDDIVKYSGLARKTINDWTNWLIKKGYIQIVKQGNYITGKNTEYHIPLLDTAAIYEDNIVSININNNNQLDIKEIYNNIIT